MTTADLQRALDEMPKAAPFYARAHAYMEGNQAEHFANPVFARLLKGSANRFRMNFARVPVTALCNRIKIASFQVTGNPEATTWLQEQWDANGLGNLYKEIVATAASSGSAYVMAWPDPDAQGERSDVEVNVCDPASTRAFFDPENPSRVLYVSRAWTQAEPGSKVLRTRVNLYYSDRIEKWISKARAGSISAKSFERYLDLFLATQNEDGTLTEPEAVWPVPNPYGRIPIFHLHIGSGYGRPVNKDAWEPQDAINKLTSVMMATVDYQGAPQRYALENPTRPDEAGVDDWDNDVAVDPMVDTDDDPAVGTNGTAGLKSGPGGMWFLNAKSVGQFSPAEAKAFLEPMVQYIKTISTTCETPLHLYAGMGDVPSGESLRAANSPLNDNAKSVEGWLEPTFLDFMKFILAIGGFENVQVTMTWANPERADDKDFWDSIKVKIEAGVPQRVALVEAGYTPEQVDEWYPPTQTGIDLSAETETTILEKFSALGVAIRAGVDPVNAAAQVGLAGLTFTGAIPTSLRPAAVDASALEQA